jgi:hypothetical protein
MAGSELGLIFRIKSESSQAKADLAALRATVAKETKAIETSGKQDFAGFRKAFDKEMTAIKDGVKDAALKTARDFGISAEGAAKLAAGLKLATVAAVGIGAAAIGAGVGIFQMVKSVSEAIDDLADLSAQTNINIETLSALRNLTEDAGGDINALSTSLVFFQRQMFDANDATSKQSKLFRALRIDTKHTEKGFRDAFAALFQMGEGYKQTEAAAQLFGTRGGKTVLGLIKESNGDLDGAIERYRKLQTLIGKDAAEAANKFQKELVALQQELRGVMTSAAIELMPVITKNLQEISQWVRDNREEIKSTIATVGKFLDAAIVTPLKFIIGLLQKAGELSIWLKSLAPGGDEGGQAYYIPTGILPYDIAAIKPGGGAAKPKTPLSSMKWGSDWQSNALSSSFNLPSGGGGAKDNPRIAALEREGKELQRQLKKQTEDLKHEYDEQTINLQTFTDQTIEKIKEAYEKRRAIILEQQSLAKSADKQKYAGDLTALDDEKSSDVRKAYTDQTKTLLSLKRDFEEKILDLQDEFDKRKINATQKRIELDASTEVEGLTRIAEIQEAAFKRREADMIAQREELRAKAKDLGEAETIQEVQLLDAQINIIRQKWYTQKEENERLIADANARLLEQEAQFRGAMFSLLTEYATRERAMLRKSLDDAVDYATRHTIITRESRAKIAADRAIFDLEEIDARYARLKAQRDADEADLLREAKLEEDKRVIRERYAALRLQDEERQNAERRARMEQANEEAGEVDIKGDIKEWFNTEFPDLSPMEVAASTITNAFKTMKGAVLESIDAFIFFGATIGQVMRRAVAEVLASIAKEAAIQGIKEAAMALASLAILDFRGAALHGAASAAWFSIAGVSMLAGRAVAAPLYQQAGAGASAATSRGTQTASASNEPKPIDVNRRGGDSSAITEGVRAAIREELAPTLKGLHDVLRQYKPQSAGDVLVAGSQTVHGQSAIGEAWVQSTMSGGRSLQRLKDPYNPVT